MSRRKNMKISVCVKVTSKRRNSWSNADGMLFDWDSAAATMQQLQNDVINMNTAALSFHHKIIPVNIALFFLEEVSNFIQSIFPAMETSILNTLMTILLTHFLIKISL
jgi:hypothetical protein